MVAARHPGPGEGPCASLVPSRPGGDLGFPRRLPWVGLSKGRETAQLNAPSDAAKPSVRGGAPLPGPRASGEAGLGPHTSSVRRKDRRRALGGPRPWQRLLAIPGEGGGLWPPLGHAVWPLNSEAPVGATVCDAHLLSKSQKTGQPWP